MRLKNKYIVFLFVAWLCLFAVASYAEIAIPDKPYNHVVDLAGIIDDNIEDGLNRYLLELEQKTTAQMVILTITSLEGQSIEDLSIDIAHKKWKLGQKGKDNGALLLVSLQDRKYRFETGYGLEGVLPDSLTGSIGRQYLVPYFRKGDYSNGIAAAVLVAINKIADDAGVEISGMPKLRSRSTYADGRTTGKKPTLMGSIFTILFLIGLVYMFIKHPRLLLLLLAMNMMGGGRRSGWSGGGGFGGGGSFGGGGGGGFGGGGSSGGW
ncbi:MAG: TPM domain-containing protein [Nitrospirae bacterium]|nr:TPM domain-containing protein [Nitrospirota bacterium]